MTAGPFTPSGGLIAPMVAELRRHEPFARMAEADVARFVTAAEQTYHAPGETVTGPQDGPAPRLYYVRRGTVDARGGVAELAAGGVQHEPGDLFPAAAVAGERAATSTYEAVDDLFCLAVDAAFARDLATRSAPWADFLVRRVQRLLSLSRAALQAEQGALALAEQSLEAPLSRLPRKTPVAVPPGTPLVQALRLMQERRVGSVLVMDAEGQATGILTRHDVLERVALARPPDDTPIERVASAPVATLPLASSAQDAALAMSRLGIRHLPLTEDGRVVGIVSERDLFGLQRLSLKHVGSRIRAATDRGALVAAAADIRRFARHLLAQGLAARALTELLSHLNDLLTERLLQLTAQAHGLDLGRACWLAFGSEGRSEQTIATDQDNGLVLDDAVDDAERARWLALAREVNVASSTGWRPARPTTCSRPASTSTCARWPARGRWPTRCARRSRGVPASCRAFASRWPTTRCAPARR